MEFLYYLLFIVGGFLFGSIMFCGWIPKRIFNKDICKISVDGNPGAFNTFKHFGWKVGTLCLLLDISKGLIPVLLASFILDTNNIAFSFVMMAPALGHAIGLFNNFHGGKCIATSFGIMFGLIPVSWIGVVTLIILYIFFSTVVKIKNAAKRSVLVYVLFLFITGIVFGIMNLPYVAIGSSLVAILPVIKFIFAKNGLVDNKFKDDTMSKNICKTISQGEFYC